MAQTKERDDFEGAKRNAAGWLSSIEDMLAEFQNAAGDQTKEDGAQQTIEESVLSVLVRDGWRTPGAGSEGAEEYEILLSTGGPALRIWGKLDQHDQPQSAELQMQDWFLPWTRYPAPEATLLKFANFFYFGG